MRSKSKLLLILLVVISLLALWWNFHPSSDERNIRRHIATLVSLGEKVEAEPPLTSLRIAAELGAGFTDPCSLNLEKPYGVRNYDRRGLLDAISIARSRYRQLHLEILALTIVLEDKDQARAEMRLRSSGIFLEELWNDMQAVSMTLNKSKDGWLIAALTVRAIASDIGPPATQ